MWFLAVFMWFLQTYLRVRSARLLTKSASIYALNETGEFAAPSSRCVASVHCQHIRIRGWAPQANSVWCFAVSWLLHPFYENSLLEWSRLLLVTLWCMRCEAHLSMFRSQNCLYWWFVGYVPLRAHWYNQGIESQWLPIVYNRVELQRAREEGDYLIAGVFSDAAVAYNLGEQHPVMTLNERMLSVIGWVKITS